MCALLVVYPDQLAVVAAEVEENLELLDQGFSGIGLGCKARHPLRERATTLAGTFRTSRLNQ